MFYDYHAFAVALAMLFASYILCLEQQYTLAAPLSVRQAGNDSNGSSKYVYVYMVYMCVRDTCTLNVAMGCVDMICMHE